MKKPNVPWFLRPRAQLHRIHMCLLICVFGFHREAPLFFPFCSDLIGWGEVCVCQWEGPTTEVEESSERLVEEKV